MKRWEDTCVSKSDEEGKKSRLLTGWKYGCLQQKGRNVVAALYTPEKSPITKVQLCHLALWIRVS